MTGDAYERFRRDYAPAFLQYLSDRGEGGRRSAYELGRRAISQRLSVLDLARIHHSVLLEVLKIHQTSQAAGRAYGRDGYACVTREGQGRLSNGEAQPGRR